jgi:hypothetical protein
MDVKGRHMSWQMQQKNLEKQPTHKHCEKNKSMESLIWRSKKDSERQNILSDLASDVVVHVMFSV